MLMLSTAPLPAARRELFAQLDRIDPGKYCLAILVRPEAGASVTMLLNALEERFPNLELTAEPLPEAPDDGTEKFLWTDHNILGIKDLQK